MSRPLLITSGSRGDVEPMFALASALADRADVEEITLVIPSDQAPFAPYLAHKLHVATFAFNLADCWKFIPSFNTDGAPPPSTPDPLADLRVFGAIIRGMIFPHAQRLFSIAKEANCSSIVSGSMTMTVAQIASQVFKIPLVWLQFQPIMPSAYYPNLLLRPVDAAKAMMALQEGRVDDAYSEDNYANNVSSINAIFEGIIDDLNRTREEFQLSPLTIRDIWDLYAGKASNLHLLINVPSVLTPRTPDMPDTAHVVGSVAASYVPPGWKPGDALVQFLGDGVKPIVVSYGSMDAQGVAESVTREILEGLKAAGVERVVLLPGHAGLSVNTANGDEWLSENVFVAKGNVQYSWLLPQCDLILCHGGAGTVSAAVAAGIPIVATPLIMDQFFFSELVQRMGVAVRLGSVGLSSITASGVVQALRIVNESGVRARAKKLGQVYAQSGEGAEMAARILTRV